VTVEAFDILGDPVRRRILELLADGDAAAGEVVDAIQAEFGLTQPAVSQQFGLTQPAVSQQLCVLRVNGFAAARAEAPAGSTLSTVTRSTTPQAGSPTCTGNGAGASTPSRPSPHEAAAAHSQPATQETRHA
jgi:hypothetical protein